MTKLFVGIVIGYFLGTLAPIQTRYYASLALQKLIHVMSSLSQSLSNNTNQPNQPINHEVYIPRGRTQTQTHIQSQPQTQIIYQSSPRYQTTTPSSSPDGSSF